MEKTISVIVPVYNVQPYLERCIQSIVNQTYRDLEILLIDDGSTDGSGAICDEYAGKDERIKVVHKENGGVSSARNLGLDIAKGEYIGFIDSDDYIENTMYENLYKAIKDQQADLAVCGFEQVRVNGEAYINDADDGVDWSKENIVKHFFMQGPIKELMYAPWNKLYKKSLLNQLRFRTEYRMGEDILFLFECVDKAEKVAYAKGAFYYYVMREGSAMTSAFSAKRLEYIYAIRDVEKLCSSKYPYASEAAQLWVYQHVLNTLRQIIVTGTRQEFAGFYEENKKYLRDNKKQFLRKLSLNRRVDYHLIMHSHLLLKLKVRLT